MNLTKQEMWISGFSEYINDTSKQDRILQCRHCSSIEIHNQKFFSLYGKPCEKGCGMHFTGKDLVPLPTKCQNCGSQKGFDFPDDSGIEEAELANHEMYAKGKASLLEQDVEELDDIESEFAENTQIAENTPAVKGKVEQQIFTIEPSDRFESSGIVERDSSHKGNIQETCYAHLVNPGNTPHMQKKIPISKLIAIRKSVSKSVLNAWENKTYGSRELNAECKLKMGFSIECQNMGDRKLSDQQVKRILTNIYFAQDKIKEIKSVQIERKLTVDELIEMNDSEDTVLRCIAILKTGNISSGHQSPMYETKINTYDPVSLEKLQMELDIPWNEEPVNLEEFR